jgi:hypothetical protein
MLLLVLCHCVRKLRATWRLGRAAMQAALLVADCHVQVTGCKFAEKSKGVCSHSLTRSPVQGERN